MRALDDLVQQGKVRAIGCSNYSAGRARRRASRRPRAQADAVRRLPGRIQSAGARHRARPLPAIEAHGMSLLPYFPLASGLLTGKYKRNAPLPEGRAARLQHAPRLRFHQRAQLDAGREARSGCRKLRPFDARARVRLAPGQARGRQRHRRRDQARADRAECRGRRARRPRPPPLPKSTRSPNEQAARPHHRRFGRRAVRGEPAAQHRLGRGGVRAQRATSSPAAAPASARIRSCTT